MLELSFLMDFSLKLKLWATILYFRQESSLWSSWLASPSLETLYYQWAWVSVVDFPIFSANCTWGKSFFLLVGTGWEKRSPTLLGHTHHNFSLSHFEMEKIRNTGGLSFPTALNHSSLWLGVEVKELHVLDHTYQARDFPHTELRGRRGRERIVPQMPQTLSVLI